MKQLTYFMYSRVSGFILIGFIAFQFSSCTGVSDTKQDFDPSMYMNSTESISMSYKDCDIEEDNCTYISLSYPEFELKEKYENVARINEKVKLIVFGDESQSAEDLCKTFIKDYDDFISDPSLESEDYTLAWYDIREAEITSIQKRVISLASRVKSFYGGAHPNEYVYLRNFNPYTGDSIGLGMVFSEEALVELTHLGENAFRRSENLDSDVSYETAGYWFEDNQFELSDNFAFTEQGLWFYYNNYEIAPYSMGHSEFILPYNIVMHLFDQ